MTTTTARDTSLHAHLLRRAGFGATPEELDHYSALSYEDAVEELLRAENPQNLPDDLIRRYHTDMHELRFSNSAAAYWLYRMVTTKAPMQEKIALFWHGIFATGYAKTNQARSLLNQIEMFRNFGLGKLDDLLLELARDPSMIIWLDNQDNHNGAINENWGRELLELFTLGIGNYTEDDVKEASRAFTGWTLGNAEYMAMRASKDSIWPYGRIAWHFDFRDGDHDHGEKTFLGETGDLNGDDIIRIICRQPATARYIARHLYDYFVADEEPVPQWPYTPPKDPEAIDALAQAYFDGDHNIGHMLKVLFNSDFFKEAQFARVKGPAELVAGTMRLSGGVTRPMLEMISDSDLPAYMGQTLLNPPSVEGWHEGTEWINSGSLVERVNFAAKEISDITKPGVRVIIDMLANADGGHYAPDALVDRCLEIMGTGQVDQETRDSLVGRVAEKGPISLAGHQSGDDAEQRVGELLGLIASTTEYQLN
ncbi:MAG: DUF1800 domain-containing protein [Chloroflexi bacterium]|nr:DUF1800 domain-containing protein [Chloroflexota bacterium]MCI0822613.1 DUF1800 domain-containing protein [Chloroflexota bacterium]MCI0841581.1 DUF1800 domain-containing protein [Chloroflexota bacterium]MCI0869201.1 DUF1800 domain-containing protein [Chloroflexota bacterium]MCI0887223.1 DUF1800 domain-containing protein [Chloroflexota bacterium]